MMIRASSSAQPFRCPASARTISVAKPRGFPHGFARAASDPRASRFSVRAPMAVPQLGEHVPGRIDHPDNVRPLDTTLPDGEQSPGAIMTSNDTLLLAHQRARPGVVNIEAGFSPYSPEDLDAVHSTPMEGANTHVGDGKDVHVLVICDLSECNQRDMNQHTDTILATSKILTMPVKPEQAVDIPKEAVSYAACEARAGGGHPPCRLCPVRLNRGFLYHIPEEEIKAGGTTLNIINAGYTLHVKLTADLKANTPGIDHSVFVGPLRLEVTINGSGERAKNASLDEVQEQSELHAQTHKATVGANVIALESGNHQDLNGMRKFKGTSETTSSGDVGSTHENEFDNDKLSGSHTLGTKLVELGYDKEINPCKCVNEDAEEKKPPRLRKIIEILNLVMAVFGVGEAIIRIGQQSPECLPFMWQMAQTCLRVIAFIGLGTTLVLGFAMMGYGMAAFLKAKSTSHTA